MKNRALPIMLLSVLFWIPVIHAADKPTLPDKPNPPAFAAPAAKAAQKDVDQKQGAQTDILERLGRDHSDDLQWYVAKYWMRFQSHLVRDNVMALVPMVVKADKKGQLFVWIGQAQKDYDDELKNYRAGQARMAQQQAQGQPVQAANPVILLQMACHGNHKNFSTSTEFQGVTPHGPMVELNGPNGIERGVAAIGRADGTLTFKLHPGNTGTIKQWLSITQIEYGISLLSNAANNFGQRTPDAPIQLDDRVFATHCSLPPMYRKTLETNYNFGFTDAQKKSLEQLNKAQAALVPAQK